MEKDIIIRDAKMDDSKDLAILAGQLGYPCTENEVRTRIVPYLNNKNSRIVVAEIDNKVVGWTSLDVVEHFYMEKYISISGLVIDERLRGLGIGHKIINESITWTKGKKINIIKLSANVIRKDAHKFYEKNGFKKIKEQYVFINNITSH